ncbi:hypothetical protein VDG1235_1424 [Verrucomicrobiia bacterium DG1235]|nr:hypothetical protein VDG1235_1424 [Verrucomicrobiae bacterium DG1235]
MPRCFRLLLIKGSPQLRGDSAAALYMRTFDFYRLLIILIKVEQGGFAFQ